MSKITKKSLAEWGKNEVEKFKGKFPLDFNDVKALNPTLIEPALEYRRATPAGEVIDMYCGNCGASHSITFADYYKYVHGLRYGCTSCGHEVKIIPVERGLSYVEDLRAWVIAYDKEKNAAVIVIGGDMLSVENFMCSIEGSEFNSKIAADALQHIQYTVDSRKNDTIVLIWSGSTGITRLTDSGNLTSTFSKPNWRKHFYSNVRFIQLGSGDVEKDFGAALGLWDSKIDSSMMMHDGSCFLDSLIESEVNKKTSSPRASIAADKRKNDDLYYATVENDDVLDVLKRKVIGLRSKGIATESDLNTLTIMSVCPECGHTFRATKPKGPRGPIRCSHCGYEYPSIRGSYLDANGEIIEVISFVDFIVDKDQNLVENFYDAEVSASMDSSGNGERMRVTIKQPPQIKGKVVYRKKDVIYYVFSSSPELPRNHRYFDFGSHLVRVEKSDKFVEYMYRTAMDSSLPILNELRESDGLMHIIENSIFKDRGLIEMFEANPRDKGSCLKIGMKPTEWANPLRYLEKLTRYPIIEQLTKCKLYDLAETVAGFSLAEAKAKGIDTRAANIRDVFGLSKQQAKLLIQYQMPYEMLKALKEVMAFDPQLEYSDFDWFYSNGLIGFSLMELLEQTKLSLSKIREYITSCYYDQCIDYNEALRLWDDYVKMMVSLSFSEKEMKKELRPRSLKKAHDVLVFASRSINDEKNAEVFLETVEECKHYRYTYGDYMIVTPESAEDLIREGIDLNHSVAQHIERVAKKGEYIVFIRRKSNPDESFYTVELLKDKTVVQVRGNSNRPVTEDDVKFFLQKWAAYKKLTLQY